MSADFAAELQIHRSYLMRVAQLQLRDRDSAEDVVQDTLLAALAGRDGFTGRSSVKTWLTGILKHKIVDAIRRRQRDPILESSLPEEIDLEDFDGLFKAQRRLGRAAPRTGAIRRRRSTASSSSTSCSSVSRSCPRTPRRVFMMREVMELESDEICKELLITANNLWVILYRARMALRQCLEQNWFGQPVAR